MTAAGSDPRPQHQRDQIADAAGGVLVEYRAGKIEIVPAHDLPGIPDRFRQCDGLVPVHAVEIDGHGEGADLRVADTAVGDTPHDQIEHLAIERLTVAFTTNDFLGQHDMDPQ